MKCGAAFAALAPWALAQGAQGQEPVPFDYRCDAAAAASTPAALPADGWQRTEDGLLPRVAGSSCWLRIDVARLAPRVLSVGRFSQQNMDVAVFSRDGRPLASASRAGLRDQVMVGLDDSNFSRMLFPTLLAEAGPVLIRVQRSRDVTLTAVDLVPSAQGKQNFNFVHLGVGVFYVIVTLVAASLGVFGRDRGQFVFAALFAWLALSEWVSISPSLPSGLASGVWPPAVWGGVWAALLILAAAQALQLRERAPRWYRRMVVTGVLFLLSIPLRLVDSWDSVVRLVFPLLPILFSVVGIAASWHVWRFGHRVGAVGVALFALDAVVYVPYFLASLVGHFVPIDTLPFEFSALALLSASAPALVFVGAIIHRAFEQLRSAQREREARAAAEAANEAKSAFLATMSHETARR